MKWPVKKLLEHLLKLRIIVSIKHTIAEQTRKERGPRVGYTMFSDFVAHIVVLNETNIGTAEIS